jgi:hypothetical protein
LFVCFAETQKQYFNDIFIENIINNKCQVTDNIIFDKAHLGGIKTHGTLIFLNTNVHQYCVNYKDYNIILVTDDIDSVKYVQDYFILKKDNPESHLTNGAVEVDNSYFDWYLTVLVNHRWQRPFTEDISKAFKVNLETKKIEPFEYKTIRLHSED